MKDSNDPEKVRILCQFCGKPHSPRRVYRSKGTCSVCGYRTWAVSAEFDPQWVPDAGTTAVGMAALMLTGFGWTASTKEVTVETYPGVD